MKYVAASSKSSLNFLLGAHDESLQNVSGPMSDWDVSRVRCSMCAQLWDLNSLVALLTYCYLSLLPGYQFSIHVFRLPGAKREFE